MDNTVNETWINKLVDEFVDSKGDVIRLSISSDQLDTLVTIILNNARLAYNGEGLRIENDTAILEYLRVIYPSYYESKLKSLKDEREAELVELQAKAEAEKAKKEA